MIHYSLRMKIPDIQFLCSECGDAFPKWLGKCPSCGSWNSLKEFKVPKEPKSERGKVKGGTNLVSIPVQTKNFTETHRIKTGFEECDRVFGNGIFPGSFILLGGNPGIGKSTLALQIFLHLNKEKETALYFSGEESQEQIFHRSQRMEKILNPEKIFSKILSTNSLEDIVETIEREKPSIAIIDSIQMVGTENSPLGNIAKIRENAEILLHVAKSTGTGIIVIGHVTKEEEIAGPKILEHIVDAVLQLEGDANSEIRILRPLKNRFGSTFEVGVFEMIDKGLRELKNPSEFFLAERARNASGSAITVMREGSRNFLMEIQALTLKTNFGLPRRTSRGVDISKFHLLLAVVSKFTNLSCESYDAYLNVTSNLRITESACDLAIVAAIMSSRLEKEIPATTVILGEVGLSGEVRSVASLESRIHEAEKLGFQKAIVPIIRNKINISKSKIQIKEIKMISELGKELF